MQVKVDGVHKIIIGLVVPALEGGGGVPAVARFIMDTAMRAGYEVRLISLATSAADAESTYLLSPSGWLKRAKVRRGCWQGMAFSHVGAVCTELEFQRYRKRSSLTALLDDLDLIQIVTGFPAWANSVVGLGKPVSLHVATLAKVERRRKDANPKSLAAWWRKTMTALTAWLDDRALRAVDAVQLMNPWMLSYAENITRRRTALDVRIAPPGVNSRLFVPSQKRVPAAKQYILCVGRLDDPRKNICLLLAAVKLLPAHLAHVQLVTAGAARPPFEYWAQVKSEGLEGRVHHVNRPETGELVSLYQQANVLALPSDEEGFGMVILEAMACAVPVVATRCGGPDGIISDGKDGFLVPLDDAAAMADRLTLLCSDTQLNQRMGREARATVEARFADDVAGQAFVDVWEKLLQTAGKH